MVNKNYPARLTSLGGPLRGPQREALYNGDLGVLERKVTEKHYEKGSDGQILNGWNEQYWIGNVEERNAAGKVTFKQAYETTFQDAKPLS